MSNRFVAIHLGALYLLAFCSWSFAETPLVIAELDGQRTIAEAEVARADAEYEIASWRLTQLNELVSRGHASWQEVAEQAVTVQAAAAEARASEQFLNVVLQLQSRLAEIDLQQARSESESVKLSVPGTFRMVAWIPIEAASLELSKRHLENLRIEHESLSQIDVSSFEAAIEKAKRAVQLYGKSEHDADLLSRAKIQLRVAAAECERARARKNFATITARRVELVRDSIEHRQENEAEPSSTLAQAGTRFVDATCNRDLVQLVGAIATDQTVARGKLAWLEHERTGILGRIDAWKNFPRRPGPMLVNLNKQDNKTPSLNCKSGEPATHWICSNKFSAHYNGRSRHGHQMMASSRIWVIWMTIASPVLLSFATRHYLDLQQLSQQTAARRAAIQAQSDYMIERAQHV